MAKKDYILCIVVLVVLIGFTYIGSRWSKVPSIKYSMLLREDQMDSAQYKWQSHVDSIRDNAVKELVERYRRYYPKLILVSKLKDTNMIKWAKDMHINPKAMVGYDSVLNMYVVDGPSNSTYNPIITHKKANNTFHAEDWKWDTTDVRKQDLKWTIKQSDTSFANLPMKMPRMTPFNYTMTPIIEHSEIKPRKHKLRFHDSIIKFGVDGEGMYIAAPVPWSKAEDKFNKLIPNPFPLVEHSETITGVEWWVDQRVIINDDINTEIINDSIEFTRCSGCTLIHTYLTPRESYYKHILDSRWNAIKYNFDGTINHEWKGIPLLFYKLLNSPEIHAL